MAQAIDLEAFDALSTTPIDDDSVNHQWRLAKRPVGNVQSGDFVLAKKAMPEIAAGEVLLRTLYLNLAPVMRMYMAGTARTGEAELEIGDVIHGRGVAQIIRSRHPDWREGEIVQGQIGWQTFKATKMTPQEKFFRMGSNGLPAGLGVGALGMTGLSAHAAFFECGKPAKGDRMVLSGAAGGVGSLVTQMAARVVGCDVVGIAGGVTKCQFVEQLGCRGSIDYKSDDLPERLDDLCADGIDLYFDNVGGETLEGCLERLRLNARVVLCGSISEYAREEPFKLSNYARLRRTDSVMRGFFVYNHLARWHEVMSEMTEWIKDDLVRPVQDYAEGFAAMPRALANLYSGQNVGVQGCRVQGEPEEWL